MKWTMPKPVEQDATIARYYSAYALANGANSEIPQVRYERGWFVFASIGFGQCEKFRPRAFEDMIKRLTPAPDALGDSTAD